MRRVARSRRKSSSATAVPSERQMKGVRREVEGVPAMAGLEPDEANGVREALEQSAAEPVRFEREPRALLVLTDDEVGRGALAVGLRQSVLTVRHGMELSTVGKQQVTDREVKMRSSKLGSPVNKR